MRPGLPLAGADLGLVDAAFWEAEEAFEALLAQQPDNIRALGNYGAWQPVRLLHLCSRRGRGLLN